MSTATAVPPLSTMRSYRAASGTAFAGGVALIIGAAIQADGGILSAALGGETSVSEKVIGHPWDGTTAVTITAVWMTTQILITGALAIFARGDAVGTSRTGRVGAWMTVAGGALFSVAHLATLTSLGGNFEGSSAGIVIMTLFPLGTLLGLVGFLMAGAATAKAGVWSGWRRHTPRTVGIATLVLIPLQFTPLLPVTFTLYAITIVSLGVAMAWEAAMGSGLE